jgi:hypothetical protein
MACRDPMQNCFILGFSLRSHEDKNPECCMKSPDKEKIWEEISEPM